MIFKVKQQLPILWAIIMIWLLTILSLTNAYAVEFLSPLESAIVEELNMARQNPSQYAKNLEQTRIFYVGKRLMYPGEIMILLKEGLSGLNEAISFLKAAKPIASLRPSVGLSRAAKDHVNEQGILGRKGHYGRDGSSFSSRIERYGDWRIRIGENIDYGNKEAQRVVRSLIIGDGVSGRGHRKNIFNPDFRIVGVACGTHAVYRAMCVIDFAVEYTENAEKPLLEE